MSFEAALRFVERYGDELERHRIRYLFCGAGDDAVLLRYMEQLQNEDGGFPFNLEKGKDSSVNETCGILAILEELNLKESIVCRKAVDYVFVVQGEDGSWDENAEIRKYNPPFWDVPGDPKTKMWLTGEITRLLIKLDYRETKQVKKAADFILRHQENDGRFAGFRISTWLAIAIFGQLRGFDDRIVGEALKIIEDWVDETNDASFLIWYLQCLMDGGIPKDHPILRKCLGKLMKLHQENGSWTSADGERYRVSTTISALKLAKECGLW